MAVTKKRVWLTFGNTALVESPMLWRMSRKHPEVSFDIRQASFAKDAGIMAVLFEGEEQELEAALQFLRDQGITVEPIEKNTLE